MFSFEDDFFACPSKKNLSILKLLDQKVRKLGRKDKGENL